MDNREAPSPDRRSPASARLDKLRHRIWQVVELGHGEDRASRIFDAVLVILIIANILAFCAETVTEINDRWGAWLRAFEIASVAAFTLEYLARLWVAVEMPFLKRLPPWQARLRYARRPFMVIDLLAILPHYLGVMVGLDLRVLRALRLLRLLKLSRYSPAMHTLIRVIGRESRALVGAGFLLLVVLLISATGMYFIEGPVQPEKLGNVPLAAYWAMTTLTTVGYGDVVPVTPLGRVWAMLTMLFGLCVLALPVAIISTGFAQEVGRRDFVVNWSLMARIPLFAALDAAQIAKLVPILHAHNLPPNLQVIEAGSQGAAIWFIASGRVQLQAGNQSAVYETGDFFGAVAMLEGTAHPGRYVTLTRCRLLKLYREDFVQLEAANPLIGSHIREIAHARRLALEQKLDEAMDRLA